MFGDSRKADFSGTPCHKVTNLNTRRLNTCRVAAYEGRPDALRAPVCSQAASVSHGLSTEATRFQERPLYLEKNK